MIGIDKCNCFMSPQTSELKKDKCLTAPNLNLSV